jgi:hypothetical protein
MTDKQERKEERRKRYEREKEVAERDLGAIIREKNIFFSQQSEQNIHYQAMGEAETLSKSVLLQSRLCIVRSLTNHIRAVQSNIRRDVAQ